MSDGEDFSNHPISIAEHKANTTPSGAGKWKPRDALIAALRAIDAGDLDPTWLIITCATVPEDEKLGTQTDYFQCIPNTFYGVGLLQAHINDYMHERD